MATANDVLSVARNEIGYKEGYNNNNKYGAEYGMNYQPWCVMFIWWIFNHAGAGSLFYGGNKVALCSTLYNHHNSLGQAVGTTGSALRAGDIVFFDFSGKKRDTNHVGIVESVQSSSTIITIEGNTSSGASGSQANGDGVYRRTRSTKYVSRAYRPAYEAGAVTPSAPAIDYRAERIKSLQRALNARGYATGGVDGIIGAKTKNAMTRGIVKKGNRNQCVSWVQQRLCELGYGVGNSGVDGIFGQATKNAVLAFQKSRGLSADGVVGYNTYMALIG